MIRRRPPRPAIPFGAIRLAGLVAWALFCSASLGADSYGDSSRGTARIADLAGPRVDLIGTIIGRFQDGTESCLLVEVKGTPRTWLAPPLPAQRLAAVCNAPGLGGSGAAVGATVRMRGNLGASQSRRVGGEMMSVAEMGDAVVTREGAGRGYSSQLSGDSYPGADRSPYSAPYPYPAPYLIHPPLPMGMGWWGGFHGWWY